VSESVLNPRVNPAGPSHSSSNGILRLFVYGTLKRGFWNHDHFCQGFLGVEEAWVRGRLFETSSGILVLRVPEEDILAVGTANPLADSATQAELSARVFDPDSSGRLLAAAPGEPWGPVQGEIFTFDDPEIRLPAIDRLEGFNPGGLCLYRRVLVPVRAGRNLLLAWLYAAGDHWGGRLRELPGGIWPLA
jgi:gamma-glutamylcyclotransferase (GGCT)/AIG2-like uncharacterized protein YtfP